MSLETSIADRFLVTLAHGCPRCNFDEAEGDLVDHCDQCKTQIVTDAHTLFIVQNAIIRKSHRKPVDAQVLGNAESPQLREATRDSLDWAVRQMIGYRLRYPGSHEQPPDSIRTEICESIDRIVGKL